MRLLPDSLDYLREDPRVTYDLDRDTEAGNSKIVDPTTPDILLPHTVAEEDREPLYRMQLVRMFRQRMRLLAFLGILLLPVFHGFYWLLSPQMAHQALFPHGLMLTVCLVYIFLSPRISNLVWARQLVVAGYALICVGATLVSAMVSQQPPDDAVAQSVQSVLLAAHSQILLSVVLLPLTLWESTVMAAIVASSLAWSAWWAFPDSSTPVRSTQIFIFATTTFFVLCVAHFQSLLRRRAFDSSFDLARSAVQLQALSTLDTVTGGFNRLYLEQTLAHEVNRAARFAHPVSMVMFDLDNFKAVNDTHGHTVGDEVLRAIGEAAALTVRDVDIVARYGGDEFMIVLPETEMEDAHAIAERVQEATAQRLSDQFGPHSLESHVTLSLGIVTLHPSTPLPVAEIVTLADERLYEAKRAGKNRIAV
jgi:diguanylate cyclase (GGDEF)-like protein